MVRIKYDSHFQHMVFVVEDTGTGIDEESQKRLFTTFTKIEKNRELNKEGCGLGLTIAKNIANAL